MGPGCQKVGKCIKKWNTVSPEVGWLTGMLPHHGSGQWFLTECVLTSSGRSPHWLQNQQEAPYKNHVFLASALGLGHI